MTNLTTKQTDKSVSVCQNCENVAPNRAISVDKDGKCIFCHRQVSTPTTPTTETVSDTQKLPPFYLTEFDKKFGIKENGEWGFTPEPYDVKYSLCMTADWVGQQIQDQVEAFIVDQKQHEVAVERILENIPSLIAHIRRSL